MNDNIFLKASKLRFIHKQKRTKEITNKNTNKNRKKKQKTKNKKQKQKQNKKINRKTTTLVQFKLNALHSK